MPFPPCRPAVSSISKRDFAGRAGKLAQSMMLRGWSDSLRFLLKSNTREVHESDSPGIDDWLWTETSYKPVLANFWFADNSSRT
jgi:hypothetical protein